MATELNWFESLVCSILQCGAIPKHIAFIMDGNRRYANKTNILRAEGHKQGFETLAKVLRWCKELGINQVTLYAFSIENFKRTQDEVNSIMNLAREKCDSMLDETDKVNEAGIRVNFAGDLHLLPEDLHDRVKKIQNLTSNNNKAYLNVCIAYTSRHELVAAIKELSMLVKGGDIQSDDVSMSMFEQKLHLPRPFPELIVRTSGEVRLSDFMLWQCQESLLFFIEALWPEITIWDFMKSIFYFQCQRKLLQKF